MVTSLPMTPRFEVYDRNSLYFYAYLIVIIFINCPWLTSSDNKRFCFVIKVYLSHVIKGEFFISNEVVIKVHTESVCFPICWTSCSIILKIGKLRNTINSLKGNFGTQTKLSLIVFLTIKLTLFPLVGVIFAPLCLFPFIHSEDQSNLRARGIGLTSGGQSLNVKQTKCEK